MMVNVIQDAQAIWGTGHPKLYTQKNNFQKEVMLSRSLRARKAPAMQISGEEDKRHKKQQEWKIKFGNVHENRKEANVIGAESARR